jgi:hypothetical protein
MQNRALEVGQLTAPTSLVAINSTLLTRLYRRGNAGVSGRATLVWCAEGPGLAWDATSNAAPLTTMTAPYALASSRCESG